MRWRGRTSPPPYVASPLKIAIFHVQSSMMPTSTPLSRCPLVTSAQGAPLTDSPDLARIYGDVGALRETALRLGVGPEAATELFIEHRDIAPSALFTMMSAIKGQP